MKAKNLAHSFCCAAAGVCQTICTQRNMKIHLLAAVAAFAFAWYLGFSALEFAVLSLTVGLVLACEVLNTALEAAVDLASPEIHPVAKIAKDAAAGAVLISAVTAMVIGCLLFWPYIKG